MVAWGRLLTVEALKQRDVPRDSLAAVIINGRPGTLDAAVEPFPRNPGGGVDRRPLAGGVPAVVVAALISPDLIGVKIPGADHLNCGDMSQR